MKANRRTANLQDDAGTTLLEMVVTMALLMIFMAIFTTATIAMTRTTTKVQGLADSSEQLNRVFLNLDRSLRYATGISEPKIENGVWNVEFSNRIDHGNATDRCTQLRITSAGAVQRRTWNVVAGSEVPDTRKDWYALASNIQNHSAASGAADRPLAFDTPIGSTQSQRLRIYLVTAVGAGRQSTTSKSSATFNALNSTSATNPATVCQQAGTNP